VDATQVGADALAGPDAFGHAEIIFLFDRVPEEDRARRTPRARSRRLATNWHLRATWQAPNRLGVTVCRVLSV